MKISVHEMAVGTFVPLMESFAAILDKAIPYADSTGKDLVHARLAPDMYDLAAQVQVFCHMALDGVARLTGQPPAGRGEPGGSLQELKAQIEDAVAQIKAVPAKAFEGAEERDCTFEIGGGDMVIAFDGLQMLRIWSLPHFYFHVVTAYDILRAEGLEIGKIDYLSKAGYPIRPKEPEPA
jgi:uncharacterized protein